MKNLIILMTIVAAECVERYSLNRDAVALEWKAYKDKFQLSFEGESEEYRFKIFLQALEFIEKHNSEYENGQHSYAVGLTQFAHLAKGEYNQYQRIRLPENSDEFSEYKFSSDIVLPESLDWRTKGAVTPIKDQDLYVCTYGGWAFSTAAALEAAHKIKTGQLVSLSEQQLIDCVPNAGCGEGQTNWAYNYIIKNGGIDTEASYPFTAKDGNCKFNKSSIGATCSGIVYIDNNEESMKSAVNSNPLSAVINANTFDFYFYTKGIFNDPTCNNSTITHSVAIVGYGTENGKDYWLVKNSWGTLWGEKGYMRIARGINECGINTFVIYPSV